VNVADEIGDFYDTFTSQNVRPFHRSSMRRGDVIEARNTAGVRVEPYFFTEYHFAGPRFAVRVSLVVKSP
jgi:hypothetical protein